jgi:quinol-cytochrome oxidoreductase complex cytochrome b subunit
MEWGIGMKKRKITFLKITIFIIGLIVLSLCIFLLPNLAKDASVMNPEYAYLEIPVLLGLYLTAIPFFFGLYQSFKILNYIKREDAFSNLPVISLGYIKNCALAILVLYVIGMILLAVQNALHPGVALMGIVIIFATLVIAVFAVILQELLRSAIELKSENDLTV